MWSVVPLSVCPARIRVRSTLIERVFVRLAGAQTVQLADRPLLRGKHRQLHQIANGIHAVSFLKCR